MLVGILVRALRGLEEAEGRIESVVEGILQLGRVAADPVMDAQQPIVEAERANRRGPVGGGLEQLQGDLQADFLARLSNLHKRATLRTSGSVRLDAPHQTLVDADGVGQLNLRSA